jgi:hypothetical protein
VLYEGLDDIRANFKSKEEETGGEVADEGERDILETPLVMGIFPDILNLLLLFFCLFFGDVRNFDPEREFGIGCREIVFESLTCDAKK